MSESNNVVLITGTSTGIGKLTAELLAKNNFQVIATMRDVEGKKFRKCQAALILKFKYFNRRY